jgi:hypothetical protein
MFTRVKHGKNTSLGKIRKSEVPLAFHVLGTDLVDLFEGIEIRNSDFVWREPHDGSILFMERVNVEDSLSRHYCTLQTVMCEASIPRTW